MSGECLEKFLVVSLGRCQWPLVVGTPGTPLPSLLTPLTPPPHTKKTHTLSAGLGLRNFAAGGAVKSSLLRVKISNLRSWLLPSLML